MATSFNTRGILDDYMNIRTVPAMLSVVFVLGSLYQFGGLAGLELTWLGGATGSYLLTGTHAVMGSMGALLIAFMSSQTKRFENYEQWEQVAIAAGPIVILGEQYVTEVHDFLIGLGDPLGMQIAFVVTLVSWAVAVR